MKTIKRILSVLLALLTVFSVMAIGVGSVTASAATNGVYKYDVRDDGTALLSRAYDKNYTGKVFVVPSTIGGHKVNGITVNDFLDNLRASGNDDTITSVRIEEGIVDIDADGPFTNPELFETYGEYSSYGEYKTNFFFTGLKNLETVYLPSTLKRIAPSMFKGCTVLKKIVIPDSVEDIAVGAFEGCTSLETVKLPASLKRIGAYAFKNCPVKSISLPKSVKHIGDEAFSGCKNLKGKFTIPASLEELGDGVFAFCKGLTGFKIDKNNKLFVQKSGVLFDSEQTKIYSYLAKKEAKEYKVPSTVKNIGAYAFAGAKNLRKLTLSKNTKEIGRYAFMYCRNLKGEFTIPKKTKYIYDGAFSFCDKITGFKVADGNKYFCRKDGVLFNKKMTKLFSYPNGKSADKYTVPSKVNKLAARAFAGAKNLETVTISGKLGKITKFAFYKSSVKKVTMPNTVTKIDRSAFEGCRKLKSVKLSSKLEEMGSRAFFGCVSLERIVIPKSLVNMYLDVFSECVSLKSVKFEGNTTVFRYKVWKNCYPTVTAPKNSRGEEYANACGYEFVAI